MILQGEIENKILATAAEHKDAGFEACCAKPGIITAPEKVINSIFVERKSWDGVAKVGVAECAAALLDAVLNGFEEPLTNDDLNALGKKALEAESLGQSSG